MFLDYIDSDIWYLFFLQIFLFEQLVVYSLYHLTYTRSQTLK